MNDCENTIFNKSYFKIKLLVFVEQTTTSIT